MFNHRKSLNEQFEDSIKIILTPGSIIDEYEQTLRNALHGSNMRYNILIPSIVEHSQPDQFAKIVSEKDSETLKNITGKDKERSETIFKALHESNSIYEIESLYGSYLPDFLLKIDAKEQKSATGEDYYRKSEE